MTKRIAIPNRLQGGSVEDKEGDFYIEGWATTWKVWLHTNDWVHGTYMLLYANGKIERVTVRADEGDDIVVVKPANT